MWVILSSQVFIKVIDTNDHRPQFSTSKYEVVIPEDTAPETEILQISAVDKDEKNKLIYTLQSSIDPLSLKKFRLDPATGSLYTAEKLDHEAIQQHVLTVMVGLSVHSSDTLFGSCRVPGDWEGSLINFKESFNRINNMLILLGTRSRCPCKAQLCTDCC